MPRIVLRDGKVYFGEALCVADGEKLLRAIRVTHQSSQWLRLVSRQPTIEPLKASIINASEAEAAEELT